MPVTMRTIAEVSGVSRPVVSHILNGRAKDVRIAHATVEKVLATARELGYCRNELARSVVTGKSRTIAFVAENMGLSSYTGKIQAGLLRAATELNYAVKVYQLSADNQREMLKNILEWCIAGVVFHVPRTGDIAWLHRELSERGIPTALVNLTNDLSAGFGVTTDDAVGACEATRELIRNGCQEIVCVTYDLPSSEAEYVHNRNRGYERAMAAAGMTPRFLRLDETPKPDMYQDDYFALLTRAPVPDGIFCITDTIALGMMQAAYRCGIRMPDALKIVGFGDMEPGPYAVVPLSSVHQDFEGMGFLATQQVIQTIESSEDELLRHPYNQLLPTRLIVRESSTGRSLVPPT